MPPEEPAAPGCRPRRTGRALSLALCVFAIPLPAAAQAFDVAATQVTAFQGAAPGERVDGLVWEGGLELESDEPTFGGISDFAFVSADGDMVLANDRGTLFSGRLLYDDAGQPAGLAGMEHTPLRDTTGAELEGLHESDSEALDVIVREGAARAVRVGFERLTRLYDFTLTDLRPGGAARPVNIPAWLREVEGNAGVESVCIAPPASPVAGSTLVITEGHSRAPDTYAATLLGVADRGDLAIRASGLNPTSCAFLPDGDLLVLERRLNLLSFSMQVRRIPAQQVHAGAVMEGEVILSVSGPDIDNMEGLAVHEGPAGETRITILSDNNFSSLLRNLMLQFSLPPDDSNQPGDTP